MHASWKPSLGAIAGADGTQFRVWAPKPRTVELVIERAGGQIRLPLSATGDGYYETTVTNAGDGGHYGYLLDGEGPFPDPCSRSQPDGVHGLSEVAGGGAFGWTDAGWVRPPFRDLVIYECHIGTLTDDGTFDSAVAVLPSLKEMGVTAVEVMPVAAFPGRWGWGYDGVAMFAPMAAYGGPEGMRRFVDAAHGAGLAVILDVVYNHFGPDGNYTGLYSDGYVTDGYETPWGKAINFDGVGSEGCRTFFRENLLHWLHEYHIDGFRFDATHAIFDRSAVHILAELATAAAGTATSGQRPYLIAESHENDARYMTPVGRGGFGFDAVWTDDFHHSIRTALLGENEGYFRGFTGTATELGRVIRQGFLYEGQFDEGFGDKRGTRARSAPWPSFVYCIQNHDQVGNRPFGDRLNTTAAHGDYLSVSLLLLLLPQTPMLFQGQEFLSTKPFLYFSDHSPQLGKLVTEGRRREFAGFSAFNDPAIREAIPDPQAASTFHRSVLDADEAEVAPGLLARSLYRAALQLRRDDPTLRAYRERRLPIRTRTRGRCLELIFESARRRLRIIVNAGDRASLDGMPETATVVLASNEGRFGGNGQAPVFEAGRIAVPGHTTIVLRDY
ncbi:MAG: malto-oligosyltrehalose trehalohydrolase [Dehalococcoidia bacterium]